ncbi:MAG: LysR family transcriptional regulator [Phormidesmis sp.]
MVSLEWYRSFVAVYRVGTVSGAARELHLTQPAVSQHIAALESTLGAALFERMPRRMLPTEAGKRLYNRVVVAIETLEGIPTKLAVADAPQLIRLGAPTEFFGEAALERWNLKDEVMLKVSFGLAKGLIERLVNEDIDGAIATQKIPTPSIEYHPIFTESFWLVGPPNLELPFSPDSLRPDSRALTQWLEAQPWISYSEELPIIRRFWRVVFGQRLTVNPQFVIPDLRGIRRAVAAGLGYSVLPDYLCTPFISQKRITPILQPSKAVTNTLWLAYRKAERQSQQVLQLKHWLVTEK